MNRFRTLLLTAFLVIVVVGGVVYAQSVSNMILYTEADQVLPNGVQVAGIEIPRFEGEDKDYLINCTMSIYNPAKVTVVLRGLHFSVAIDNGEDPAKMFSPDRLVRETVGTVGMSLGDGGPHIASGQTWTKLFPIFVRRYSSEAWALNHTNAQGNYLVVLYDLLMVYGYEGTTLWREAWLPYFAMEVEPSG